MPAVTCGRCYAPCRSESRAPEPGEPCVLVVSCDQCADGQDAAEELLRLALNQKRVLVAAASDLPPLVDVEEALRLHLDMLRLVLHRAKIAEDNLAAVQTRCGALLEENRRLRADLDEREELAHRLDEQSGAV